LPRSDGFSRRGRPIQKNSRLAQLDPILRNGLLRVGGRLPAHPFLTEDERHPVILPRTQPRKKVEIHSSVTARIIEQAHRQHLHAGAEWLLRHLRARYWIMAGRATVRAVIGKCVECQVATKPLVQQKMAPLPIARLGERSPWVDVGVDFAGPFGVKPPESKKKKAAAPAEPEKRGRGRPRIKPLPTPTEKAYVPHLYGLDDPRSALRSHSRDGCRDIFPRLFQIFRSTRITPSCLF
jgi:hypothetical protein